MPYQPISAPRLDDIGNPYQVAGQAVSGLGNILAGVSEREAKRKADIEAMIQARANALYKQNEDERQKRADERAQAEADRKAQDNKARLDYQAKIAKGKQISPTLAENPSLITSRQKPATSGPSQAELDALELDSPNLPTQSVIGGQDSTAMMGAALDRQLGKSDLGVTPYSRDEVLNLAHETGQISPENYASATKPSAESRTPFGEDPILMKEINDWLKTPSVNSLISDGSNKSRAKLAALGAEKGFSGQKSFEALFGNVPAESQTLPVTQGQNLFNNIRATVNDFETQPAVQMMKNSVTKFKKADRVYQDYLNSPPKEKADKMRAVQETMLFGFAKSLDEGSAVMYNEFERILSGQGWTDQMLNALKSRAVGGLHVNDQQLAGFHSAMRLMNQELVDEARPAFETFREDLDALDPSATTRKTRPWEQFFKEGGVGSQPPAASNPGKDLFDAYQKNPKVVDKWGIEQLDAFDAYRKGAK